MMYKLIDNLLTVMRNDLQWHEELADVLEHKLDAMRRYDLSRLEALTAQEQRLTAAISASEKKRQMAIRQATLRHLPQLRDRFATARELAHVMNESYKEKLLVLSGMLREVTEKVKRLNRINAAVTKKVMGHFDYVFQVLSQTGREVGLYGREGKKAVVEQNRLVDAMA